MATLTFLRLAVESLTLSQSVHSELVRDMPFAHFATNLRTLCALLLSQARFLHMSLRNRVYFRLELRLFQGRMCFFLRILFLPIYPPTPLRRLPGQSLEDRIGDAREDDDLVTLPRLPRRRRRRRRVGGTAVRGGLLSPFLLRHLLGRPCGRPGAPPLRPGRAPGPGQPGAVASLAPAHAQSLSTKYVEHRKEERKEKQKKKLKGGCIACVLDKQEQEKKNCIAYEALVLNEPCFVSVAINPYLV